MDRLFPDSSLRTANPPTILVPPATACADAPNGASLPSPGTDNRVADARSIEALFSETQAVARIGSWERDIATGKLHWSAEMFRLLDFDRASGEPTLEELVARFHPEDCLCFEEATVAALRDGIDYHLDLRVLNRQGTEYRWMAAHGRAVRDHNGKAVRMMGTLQDVSERKAIEAEKDRLLREANLRAAVDPLTGLANHRTFHQALWDAAAAIPGTEARADPRLVGVIVMDMDNFKYFNDVYGHLTGDAVLCTVADSLKRCCRPVDTAARIGGDEFAVCVPNISRSEFLQYRRTLQFALRDLDFRPGEEVEPIPLRLSLGAATVPEEAPTVSEALHLADKRALLDKTGTQNSEVDQLRATLSNEVDGFSMLESLVAAVDSKDRYTRRHSEEVMRLARRIAESLGLSDYEKESLTIAALVHDVGKIGVPNRTLQRPDTLSPTQVEEVRRHPALGAVLVSAVPELEHTLPAVRHHHERWDGYGYPDGLAGEAIPLAARILAVADAYAALTSTRPYRRGRSDAAAREILARGAGRQWDPVCVEALLGAQERETQPTAPARDQDAPAAASSAAAQA